jgi:hypothetical protein
MSAVRASTTVVKSNGRVSSPCPTTVAGGVQPFDDEDVGAPAHDLGIMDSV